jgi:hypothetical protein
MNIGFLPVLPMRRKVVLVAADWAFFFGPSKGNLLCLGPAE